MLQPQSSQSLRIKHEVYGRFFWQSCSTDCWTLTGIRVVFTEVLCLQYLPKSRWCHCHFLHVTVTWKNHTVPTCSLKMEVFSLVPLACTQQNRYEKLCFSVSSCGTLSLHVLGFSIKWALLKSFGLVWLPHFSCPLDKNLSPSFNLTSIAVPHHHQNSHILLHIYVHVLTFLPIACLLLLTTSHVYISMFTYLKICQVFWSFTLYTFHQMPDIWVHVLVYPHCFCFSSW